MPTIKPPERKPPKDERHIPSKGRACTPESQRPDPRRDRATPEDDKRIERFRER